MLTLGFTATTRSAQIRLDMMEFTFRVNHSVSRSGCIFTPWNIAALGTSVVRFEAHRADKRPLDRPSGTPRRTIE
nr:hypothetical protein CFP56_29995 [Quercus suber]